MNEDDINEEKMWLNKFQHRDITHALVDLNRRVRLIERKLADLGPLAENIEKYPALKEAYNEFKVIEAITVGKGSNNAS